jgi:SAM-dependent methyltransferase
LILDDYLHIAHRIDRSMAAEFCPRLHGRVLDIGCGRRPYQRYLSSASTYVGLDANPDVEPDILGSALDLPLPNQSFDSVMCTEVLEHVPEPAAALRETHRVLREGGLLYVTVPQAWGLHYQPHDFYRFTCFGIWHLLDQAGFDVLDTRQMGGLFSYAVVRFMDLIVASCLFPLLDRMSLRRGRYRLAALLLLPFNVLLAPVVTLLDRWDHLNAYGWALLARKRPADSANE